MSTFKLVDWSSLHQIQDKLDKYIYEKKGINVNNDYEKLYTSKCLALLTELGELYNEIQNFKYWKENNELKRDEALKEFVDCIHFIYSLSNLEGIKFNKVMLSHKINDINYHMLELYKKCAEIFYDCSKIEYTFRFLLGLAEHLEFTDREIFEAYMKKNQENYERQVNGY